MIRPPPSTGRIDAMTVARLAEQFESSGDALSDALPVAVPDAPPVESQTIIELLATIARLTAKLSITRFRMLPWAAF
jgi:hypothetical protein